MRDPIFVLIRARAPLHTYSMYVCTLVGIYDVDIMHYYLKQACNLLKLCIRCVAVCWISTVTIVGGLNGVDGLFHIRCSSTNRHTHNSANLDSRIEYELIATGDPITGVHFCLSYLKHATNHNLIISIITGTGDIWIYRNIWRHSAMAAIER